MKVEKLRRNFWVSSEIECMLSLLREVYKVQGTTSTTNYTFVQIANRMKKRGYPNKSSTQIRRKWFQMKSAYLCYKRGNVERLLLIPEKFRSTIAQFVDKETKRTTYQELSPSPPETPSPPPPPPPSPPAPAPIPIQAPTPPINTSTNKIRDSNTNIIRDTSNPPKLSVGPGKSYIRIGTFDDFVSRVRQTHKIINSDFMTMQKILMDFEHAFQTERDAKLMAFIKNTKYDFQ